LFVDLHMNIIKYSILVFLIFPLYAGIDYNSEIQPIFNSRCINCHGGSDPEEDLSLTSYDNVMNGGDNGDVVIPFDHANSLLWQYINSGFMPPGANDLTDSQVDLIVQWINEGALPESNESMLGDINDDGQINVVDVVLLVSCILDDIVNENGDLNQDGSLNVIDIVLLVDIILNN
jgi:hypothetical protein